MCSISTSSRRFRGPFLCDNANSPATSETESSRGERTSTIHAIPYTMADQFSSSHPPLKALAILLSLTMLFATLPALFVLFLFPCVRHGPFLSFKRVLIVSIRKHPKTSVLIHPVSSNRTEHSQGDQPHSTPTPSPRSLQASCANPSQSS